MKNISIFDYADLYKDNFCEKYSCKDYSCKDYSCKDYLKFKFLNVSDDAPVCYLSLKNANSMRYRNNEVNQNRIDFFNRLNIGENRIAQPELCHSKNVYEAFFNEESKNIFFDDSIFDDVLAEDHKLNECKTFAKKVVGDGVLTVDKKIVPCITVADCVPIWFFDPIKKVFGIVHSGWKGTGIIKNAIDLASKKYGSNAKDFRIIIGPHIHSCCYTVDSERALYFSNNFSASCVQNGHLSLVRANEVVLQKCGVNPQNVLHFENCTSCDERFGSFRRETSSITQTKKNDVTQIDLSKHFTVMSAFIAYEK